MSEEYGGHMIVGSQPVYSIKLSLPGSLTMDSVDFSAKFYVTPDRAVTIQKAAMTRISSAQYNCVVNTATMVAGRLNVEITVTITENSTSRIEKIRLRDIDQLY